MNMADTQGTDRAITPVILGTVLIGVMATQAMATQAASRLRSAIGRTIPMAAAITSVVRIMYGGPAIGYTPTVAESGFTAITC